MAARRILITGANGFVGGHLSRHLADAYPDAELIDCGLGETNSHRTDIGDRDQTDSLIDAVRPTAVIHLAAVAAPQEALRNPDRAWRVNVDGTRYLAEAVMRFAPQARFIFVGSSESYGASFATAGAPVGEDMPLKPMTPYAATKAAADLLIGQMSHQGLDAVRFRPFNHTGPGQTDIYVVSAFARQIAEIIAGRSEPVIRVGNLEAKRDFLDVRDVVRAYGLAATASLPEDKAGVESGAAADRVYNLASGRAVEIRAILEKLIALSGREVTIEIDESRFRPNDIDTVRGDAARAESDLGWSPRIPLDQTIADVLSFWRAELGC
jgi:GDP-4-dehydro-6-deoxy-D-mannose reductase